MSYGGDSSPTHKPEGDINMASIKSAAFCLSSVDPIPVRYPALKQMLDKLAKGYTPTKNIKCSSKGYHTIASIAGNGRFRDLGFSVDSVVDIISKTNPKKLDVLYKKPKDNSGLSLYKEPVVNTQQLHKLLVEIKEKGTLYKHKGKLRVRYGRNSFEGHNMKESLFNQGKPQV